MKTTVLLLGGLLTLSSFWVYAQDHGSGFVVHPNQQVAINDRNLEAVTSEASEAPLAAALDIIFQDSRICCGSGSTLEVPALSAGHVSLKEIGNKLQGTQMQIDGALVVVRAEYLSPSSIVPDQIIAPLLKEHPPLMEWNGNLYLLYGVVFDEKLYYSGRREYLIHKILLLDMRFSDERRRAHFDRRIDDWARVQGLLILRAEPFDLKSHNDPPGM